MATQFGKYEIEKELGRGASGVTYLARDVALHRLVALKVLVLPHTLQGAARAQIMERFLREARAVAAIRHPCVPQIYEVGQFSGRCFLAMEYCPGQTLRDVLTMQGPMHPTKAVQVIRQVLSALQAAHALGITHRDVKPENVMLLADGSVRLMDFGIARVAGEATLTQTGTMLGTPAYMAPEQILGRPVDGRSDLFSAGVMLHEMLTGHRPFEGQTITQITHAIAYEEPRLARVLPGHLRDVIARALEKEPGRRFASASEMAAALDPNRALQPAPSAPPRPAPPTAPAGPAPAGTWAPSTEGGSAPTVVAGTAGLRAPSPPIGGVAPSTQVQGPPPVGVGNLQPCPACGRAVSPYAQACPGCGHPLGVAAPAPGDDLPGYIRRPAGHSPGLAVLLSLICCCAAGQLYNGQVLKGLVLLAIGLMLGLAKLLTPNSLEAWFVWALFWVVCVVDAGIIASRLSRGEAVSPWQFF